jgi:hypothetical protein
MVATTMTPIFSTYSVMKVLRIIGLWIMGMVMLASAASAGILYMQQRREQALSPEFRGSAQQAYHAIVNCETYKLYTGDGFYEMREMDAEKAISVAGATARTHADRLAAMALNDYLHSVKLVHLAWENRDRKSVQREYMQYGRDLKMAKQKAQTLLGISQTAASN